MVYSIVYDFAIMSFLIFISQMIKSKVGFFSKFFIPTSVIAGTIGLVCGPYILDLFSFSSEASSYSYLLVVILFAGLFLGRREKVKLKSMLSEVGDTFCLNMAAEVGGFASALLIGGIFMAIAFPEIHDGFALLLPAGFTGGHGYAAAIGGTFEKMGGWDEAITIGQTFATIGILTAVFVGILLINLNKKSIKAENILQKRDSFADVEKKEVAGYLTTNPITLDSFTWHTSLLLCAAGIGFVLEKLWNTYGPDFELPLMCLTMLGGLVLQLFLNKTKYSKFVDKETINRLSGVTTDYLVAFGIATINMQVVTKYIVPILILAAFGIIYAVFHTMVVCKRLYGDYSFERSIFIFGWITGVVAMGITLLRVVDPNNKSKTIDDYGFAYILISIIELGLVAFLPVLVLQGQGLIAGVVLAIAYVCLVLGAKIIKDKGHKANEGLEK